jgi:ADP-ribose pyrophosphatase YjhB (NUDIX family)
MAIKLTIRPPDTEKVAKVIMFDDDKILLLKRKKNQKYPEKWDLPGGHLIVGEDWEVGATREVEEETDLKISDLEFVSNNNNKRFFKTGAWHGQLFSKSELPEHDDFMWINIDKVAELNNLSDIYLSAIREAFK